MPAECHVTEAVAGVVGGDDDRVELGELGRKGWVRDVAVAANLGENLDGFVSASIRDQPAGRLWEEGHCQKKDDCGYDLEGEWETPLEIRSDVAESVAEPVGDDNADVIGTEDEGEGRASIVCFGKFRYPSWNDLRRIQDMGQK